ncbi:hypothetical protein QBC33DRAFT_559219 [Phialemonium atrogriseum]|uniref:Uncharacterized protein n=1 Tax=Phialemonium atrogriseum TaxID=1093897 RepID=A0AAJ0C3R5_9PEZI|nr:uncharacterized protein QBC33DRAFT_559219 [Phialemonium atrogriseum]KAK1767091.1 hypothetical protein QBC33DRAFT_559219 [Phialemonium atrogriseum]
MRLLLLLISYSLAAALPLVTLVSATPIYCSDIKRDLILKGDLPPEACCSYGKCSKGVVVQSG